MVAINRPYLHEINPWFPNLQYLNENIVFVICPNFSQVKIIVKYFVTIIFPNLMVFVKRMFCVNTLFTADPAL